MGGWEFETEDERHKAEGRIRCDKAEYLLKLLYKEFPVARTIRTKEEWDTREVLLTRLLKTMYIIHGKEKFEQKAIEWIERHISDSKKFVEN